MFIRRRTINGRDYYQVIRCYRERVWDEEGRRVPGGKIRNKVVASLGHHPTIEAAWRGAAEEYLATSKRGGKGDRKKWERIKKLDRVLKAYRKKRGEPFEPDPRIEEHRGKWNWSESRAAAEAKRKKEREWDEAWRRFIGGSREQ